MYKSTVGINAEAVTFAYSFIAEMFYKVLHSVAKGQYKLKPTLHKMYKA